MRAMCRGLQAGTRTPLLRSIFKGPRQRRQLRSCAVHEAAKKKPQESAQESVTLVAQEKAKSEDAGTKRESIKQFGICVAAAVAVGCGIGVWKGPVALEEYFAGYLLEQSLSIDNLFVFILCFDYFQTPKESQGVVLTYGIWSAAVLRLIMILAGVQLVENFKPLLLVFAGILVYSSYNILFGKEDEKNEDLSENIIVKSINRIFTVTKDYRGEQFFVNEDGTMKVTPLFVVLAVIELSDVIFAVDSIPAVFGVTLDPVVIYTSNMAAIFSLRAMYGFIASVIAQLRFLDKAVAIVLAFIGGKMILDEVPGGIHISTTTSLTVVAACLGGGTAASLLIPAPEQQEGA